MCNKLIPGKLYSLKENPVRFWTYDRDYNLAHSDKAFEHVMAKFVAQFGSCDFYACNVLLYLESEKMCEHTKYKFMYDLKIIKFYSTEMTTYIFLNDWYVI